MPLRGSAVIHPSKTTSGERTLAQARVLSLHVWIWRAVSCDRCVVSVRVDSSLEGIDWVQAKADLAADDFDNGRTATALCRSFEQSQHVAFARDGDRVVGMARLLSDGVCNAYLVDVWTASAYRRKGIASAMIRHLLEQVPGQHVGLQTDNGRDFYKSLGFKPQPEFWSIVVGSWLDNNANRDAP
jgi:GNAT superfamily N-acetyltransferase